MINFRCWLRWIMLILFSHFSRIYFWPRLCSGGYDSVVVLFVFFPQMWHEPLFVSLGFVAFEKVMLATELEVIGKIPLGLGHGLCLVLYFSNLLFSYHILMGISVTKCGWFIGVLLGNQDNILGAFWFHMSK